MLLWKCCTQYASKLGKLSSGQRTGKGQFSFQSQRKAMPKSVQTTAQFSSLTQRVWLFVTPWTASHQASLYQLQELAQTHIHRIGDAIQPSHPLSSPSPSAFNLSQHQGLFQWVSSSDYCTISLILHASKVMLKILQARLQQYMNWELPDVQAGFRKGRGIRDQIVISVGSEKKQENSRKTSISTSLCSWLCGSQQTVQFSSVEPLTVWITTNCSVQLLSPFWLSMTPWTATCQASLSLTNSQSLLKLMSIESVMPSNHLILCHPLNILKEMGIPDHLTCLLRNLYAGQEATVRTGHGIRDWFWEGNRQEGQWSPNGGNKLQVSDIFFSLLRGRKKQTCYIFSPSLYKFKKRFLLKFCVAIMTPGSIWT